MRTSDWLVIFGVCALAVFLFGGLGYMLLSGTSEQHRQQSLPYHTDFLHYCADNGGSIIEDWQGFPSCQFPPGIIPPDLNNH